MGSTQKKKNEQTPSAIVEGLIGQYNKNDLPVGKQAATDRFGTFKYANPYDAAYDKYSNDQNFNINMWQDAVAVGEQDKYISLIERNRGRQLSPQFYDPQYYDYETMMLELFQPFADSTDTEERFHDVYDPVEGKWVEESLGEMNSQQYIKYQLDQSRSGRSSEITRQLEQWRKDQLSFASKLGHDALATGFEIGEGILGSLAGLIDFAVAVSYGGMIPWLLSEDGNYLDAFVEYFGKNGLTALEKRTARAALDEYERTHTHFRDIDGNMTGWGTYVAGIANSIGMMVPSMIVGAFTGGTSLAWMGQATFYSSLFSQNVYENANNPNTVNSPSWLKIVNAAVTTSAEVVIERCLNSFLGGTIQNQMLGMNGKLGTFNGITRSAAWGYVAKSAAQEGLEEFLQDFSTNLVNQFTDLVYKGYGNTGVTFQTLVDSFFAGAISSVVLSGRSIARHAIRRGWKNYKEKGSGDTVIDVDGKIEKLTGVKELYFNNMLSDFQNAVNDLKKGNLNDPRTIELAQEVYGAFSVLSQYYAALTPERVKGVETLLSAVKDKNVRLVNENNTQEKGKRFASLLEASFNGAFADLQFRHMSAIQKSLADKDTAKELEDGGVTKPTSYTDESGETHYADPELEAVHKKIFADKIEEFRKEYDLIVTTDGHIAAETENVLYVSEDWLKNYTTSEIYKFLTQTQILKTLLKEKSLRPLIESLVEYDKKFTKQGYVTPERALMDLLFNPSVYQGFLLSDHGMNAHKFKEHLFRFHKRLLSIGNMAISRDKKISFAVKEKRQAYLAQIVEQIKNNMRMPLVKCVVNWGFDLQEIGAWDILDDAHKKILNEIRAKRNLIAEAARKNKVPSEYYNLAEDLLEKVSIDTYHRAIEQGLRDDASLDERLQAVAMLDYVDLFAAQFDPAASQSFTIPPEAISFGSAEAQWVADKLHEFESIYGCSPQELLRDGPKALKSPGQDRVSFMMAVVREMDERGEKSYFTFIQRKLESMLGGDYVVVPAATQIDGVIKAIRIAKKIPAEEFFSREITDTDPYERDEYIRQAIRIAHLRLINSKIRSFISDNYEDFKDALGHDDAARDWYVDNLIEWCIDDEEAVLDHIKKGIDPVTGEVFYDYGGHKMINGDKNQFLLEIESLLEGESLWPSLAEFIDTERLKGAERLLESTRVKTEKMEYDQLGYAVPGLIALNPKRSSLLDTLVHETNHVLQRALDLPGGFNTSLVEDMPKLCAYVCEHYPAYIAMVLGDAELIQKIKETTVLSRRVGAGEHLQSILSLSDDDMNRLYWAVYQMINGEMWARSYGHNRKVTGFYGIQFNSKEYIVAPDGITKFEVPHNIFSTSQNSLYRESHSPESLSVPKNTPLILDAIEYNEMERVFRDAWRFGQQKNPKEIRNTFHSKLTKHSPDEVLAILKSPGLSPFVDPTIDDLIRDPKQYLNEDLINRLDGDYRVGKVYSLLRAVIEETFENVSIDIRDGDRKYILVDDNAFSDLYNLTTKVRVDSDQNTFYKTHENKSRDDSPTLATFYNTKKLEELGVSPDIKVLIGTNYSSMTRMEDGKIVVYLKSPPNGNDRRFLYTLNHEFRHVLQLVHGFTSGFTPAFRVTQKMRTECKKYVPNIFNDPMLNKVIAAEGYTGQAAEDYIIRHYFYQTVAGELTASGMYPEFIETVPTFINMKATPGEFTIIAPWYNAETNEGAFPSEFVDLEAEKPQEKPVAKKTKKKTDKKKISEEETPPVKKVDEEEKKPREKNIVIPVDRQKKVIKKIELFGKQRYVSKKRAKGTNLEPYVGKRMDPAVQAFIIATTGKENELPAALVHGIKRGKANEQTLMKWFQDAPTEEVNQFTFDLFNKHFFHNTSFDSMQDLDTFLEKDPAFYWTASIVLRKRGLKDPDFLKQFADNDDLYAFVDYLQSEEGNSMNAEIEKLKYRFYGKHGQSDKKVTSRARVSAMLWYDGTLSGAFYFANVFKISLSRTNYYRFIRKQESIDSTMEGKDGDEISLHEQLSDENAIEGDVSLVGNSLIELYEDAMNRAEPEKMKETLIYARWEKLVDKYISSLKKLSENAKSNIREYLLDQEKLKEDRQKLYETSLQRALDKNETARFKMLTTLHERAEEFKGKLLLYRDKLERMTQEGLFSYYARHVSATFADAPVDESVLNEDGDKKQYSLELKHLVSRMQHTYTKNLNVFLNDDKIDFSWNDVPPEIQAFYEIVEENNKKIYKLKKEVYTVGKGPVPVQSMPSKYGGVDYGNKKHLNREYDLSHNADQVIRNEAMLREFYFEAKSLIAERRRLAKAMAKKLERQAERNRRAEEKAKARENSGDIITTELNTKRSKKKPKNQAQRSSDTPNFVEINSTVPMPEVLERIFSVSFTEFADTLVQYASKDENGNLYTKEKNPKEFEAALKHEVLNWEKFYDINAAELRDLTRSDAFHIVEFIKTTPFTLGSLNTKLIAFELYTLGYILEAAEYNQNNWNFSETEIAEIREFYEKIAHTAGTLLNTVKQLKATINPYRRVAQRALDEYGISEADVDDLFKAVEDLQKAETTQDRREQAKKVLSQVKNIEELMINPLADQPGKRFWSKVKSWRFLSMLSSPATWARNLLSNLFLQGFNNLSDKMMGAVLSNKGYLESQWNLNVDADPAVQKFIDEEMFGSEEMQKILNPLFENQNKYDHKKLTKDGKEDVRGRFVAMITQAIRNKYVAEHRWDSAVMQRIQKFVDGMIGDTWFIRRASKKYFAKILTIEVQRGNIDLSKGLTDEVLNLFAEAVVIGSQEYMHKTSALTTLIDGVRDRSPVLYETLTFLQPFINSGFNWFGEFLKFSPIGLIASCIRLSRLEKQISDTEIRRMNGEVIPDNRVTQFLLRRDVGKGLIGLAFSVLGVLLYFAGLLRIDEEDEKFYVRAGDLKVDISSVFGSSSIFFGAAVAQGFSGDAASFEQVLTSMTESLFEGFVVSDMISRHQYDENFYDFALTETENAMKSFVPQIWQLFIRTTTNKKIKYSKGMLGMFQRWINSFSPFQVGAEKVYIYTGDVQTKYPAGSFVGEIAKSGIAFGLKFYDTSVGETEQFAIEHGINRSELSGTIKVNGKEMTLDRFDLNKKYGQLNDETLLRLEDEKHYVQMEDGSYKTLSWNKLSETQKKTVIDRTMTENAKIAKIYVWTQKLGRKYYATESLWKELRRLGITRNVYKGDKDFVE